MRSRACVVYHPFFRPQEMIEMTTKLVARCSIYDTRPEICRVYPKVDHYVPPQCTYYFKGDVREGSCACGEGACCAAPRRDGEPGGTPMPDVVGGMPCKYLTWVEPTEVEKTAEDSPQAAGQSNSMIEALERCVYDHD